MSSDPFADLPKNHFGAILADPPWSFECWGDASNAQGLASDHYQTMSHEHIAALSVSTLASVDCCLFLWICWPTLPEALEAIKGWGFKYKTCGFAWLKGNSSQLDMFPDDQPVWPGLGHWTRANSEVCLLATRGTPKRLNADVRQGIIAPNRGHSRKPDCVHERIERLVAGPYLELFARQSRPGWTTWGNEATKFDNPYDAQDDFAKSLQYGYDKIRERVANGGRLGFMEEND